MKLSGEHFDQLHTALLSAFNRAELTLFVRTELGVDLDHVAGSDTLNEVVTELISWAERNELVADLVAKAAQAVPRNVALQQAAADYPTWRTQSETAAFGRPSASAASPAPVGQENQSTRLGMMLGFGILLAAGTLALLFGLWLPRVQSPLTSLPPATESAAAAPTGTFAILSPGLSAAAPTAVHATDAVTAPPTVTVASTAAATSTPLPFPTARPGDYLVIVSEFYPPLSEFHEFDALDMLVSTLQDAFAAYNASRWRIEEHPYPIMDAEQARLVGETAQARAVIWGRVSSGRLSIRITSTLPQSERVATRLDSGPSVPDDAFFDEYAPDRLQTYIAPFIVGQYFMHVKDYAKAQELFTQAIAATAADPTPDGIEYAHLLAGNADFMLADYQAAQDHYSSALHANSALHDAYYNSALTHAQLQEYTVADQLIHDLLAKAPDYTNAHVYRGVNLMNQAYDEQDETTQRELRLEAKAAFEQALATLPPDEAAYAFDIHSNLAVVYERLGDLELAEAGYERALGANHDCAPVFDSPFARYAPERAGNMCAQAAYSYGGLLYPINAANSGMSRKLADLVLAHATAPLMKSYGLAWLAEIYQFEGKSTEACHTAKRAATGAPEMPDLHALVGELCATPTPPDGFQ